MVSLCLILILKYHFITNHIMPLMDSRRSLHRFSFLDLHPAALPLNVRPSCLPTSQIRPDSCDHRLYPRHRVPHVFALPRIISGKFKISEGQLRSVPAFSSSARVLSRRHGSLSASKKRVSFTAFLLFFLLFSYNSHTISEFFDSVKRF